MGVIYKIQHKESGKIYIGQTVQPLKYRIRQHINDVRGNYPVDNALRKYGIDAFKITVIDYDDNINLLNFKEQFWIAFYDCIKPKGYNITSGGKNYIPNEETRRKISEANKGKLVGEKHPMYGKRGELSPNYGRHHTEEAKQKMSESCKGR